MRVLVVVDNYVPGRTSIAVQMRDLVRELVAQGHDPTVIVPVTKLTQSWRLDDVDGVQVLRVRTPKTKDVGKIRRALSEWWLPYGLLRGLRSSPLADTRWEGLIWYSPTIFLAPLVHALKQRWGCRGYLILRDLFPDWAVDAGIMRKGIVYRWLKRVERQQYAVADVIGVQASANAPLVRTCSPIGASIEVLNNWLTAPQVVSTSHNLSAGPLCGKTIFVYAGNMGAAQGMDCLIDLAYRMRNRPDVGFLFVGRGSDVPRLRARAAEESLANVQFLNEIDSDEIPGLLAQCHIGLIALDPRHTTHNIPGKLLTYLHAGLPVLARINSGNDLEGLIRDEEIGLVVAGDEQEQLLAHAATLADNPTLRANMAGKGRELAQRMFSPSSAVTQILEGLRMREDSIQPNSAR